MKLTRNPFAAKLAVLLSRSLSTSHSAPVVELKESVPFSFSAFTASALILLAVGQASQAAVFAWDGGSPDPGGNNNWSTVANWNPDGAPATDGTATLSFDGTVRPNPVNDFTSGTTFNYMYFGSNSGNFVLSGNDITMVGTGSGLDGIALFDTAGKGFDTRIELNINTTGTLDLRTTNSTSAGADLTMAGVISGPGNLLKSVTSESVDTVYLTRANTYTGSTQIQAGVLSINTIKDLGVASSLGAPTTEANGTILMGGIVGNSVQLIYTGTGDETNRVIDLSGASALQTITQSGTNLLKFTNGFTATGTVNKTLTLNGSTSGRGEIAGAIFNPAGQSTRLIKSGSGTWTLSGTNTYTGTTTVSGGTLVVGVAGVGSLGDTAVAVKSGATLKGSGVIGTPGASAASVTIESGGVLAPGNSPGLLTVNEDLTLASGSIFEWELAANKDTNDGGTRGTDYDAVTVNGNLTISADAIFKVIQNPGVDFNDVFWNTNQVWTNIFSVSGGTMTSGWTD
jgi:autotransporter-associated beta strand protein